MLRPQLCQGEVQASGNLLVRADSTTIHPYSLSSTSRVIDGVNVLFWSSTWETFCKRWLDVGLRHTASPEGLSPCAPWQVCLARCVRERQPRARSSWPFYTPLAEPRQLMDRAAGAPYRPVGPRLVHKLLHDPSLPWQGVLGFSSTQCWFLRWQDPLHWVLLPCWPPRTTEAILCVVIGLLMFCRVTIFNSVPYFFNSDLSNQNNLKQLKTI